MVTTTQEYRFADRHEAGVALAKRLAPAYANKHALVLGIPRGGIVVGYEVAKRLHAELSVLITKKLPHPLQEEMAVGAIAEDGSTFLTPLGERLSKETVAEIIEGQTREIESRIRRFRQGRPLPSMAGRIVILVDDGIATGATLVPALTLCQAQHPARIVIAAPVSGRTYVPEIDALTHEVVVLQQPADFYGVGQAYEDFHGLSDEEVIPLLDFHGHPV